jgi:hypothetical protein
MSDMEIATRITGPCSCHEAYTSRKLIAPDCMFHDLAVEIAEALQAARAEALEEAATVLDQKAEVYRLYGERAFKEGDEKHAAEMWGHHATLWDAAAAIRAVKP